MFAQVWEAVGDFVTANWAWIMPILTVAVLLALYVLTTKPLRRYVRRRAQSPESAQGFMTLWRYLWFGAMAVFLIVSFSGSIAALGVSAAFLGMIMGWSLQAPVTGIAAWLMIVLKRPFKIGDRIIISGVIGDVVDITLTHIVLNQVGGTIGGEEKSGRGVLIPNAILFQQIIYNYAFETKFLLDEVVVLVTFESDVDEAERVCHEAAAEVSGEIIRQSGQNPFTRVEIGDSGIRIRLRYQTLATERQRISSEISRRLIQEFNRNDLIEFAYPHTEVLHRPKEMTRGRKD